MLGKMQQLLLEQQEKTTAKSLKNLRSNELRSSSSESSNEDAAGCAWGCASRMVWQKRLISKSLSE